MKLEISLHASKLENVAGAFKGTSDPYAVVTQIATTPGTAPVVLGKTEVMKNSLSPNWVKVFEVDYELGTPMKIAIQIYDEVRKGDNKSMGSSTFEIGNVLGARGNCKARKLKKGGTLFCHVAKAKGSGHLRLGLSATKLKNTEGFMRKSDPFFELNSRRDGAGNLTWDNVYRSEKVKDNLSPNWKDATVSLSVLNQGEMEKPILIQVFDHESDGDHKLMGKVETSVKELTTLVGSTLDLKLKGSSTGTLNIQKVELAGVEQLTKKMEEVSINPVTPVATFVPPPSAPTFADYIGGGCEINVGVAIDFTGSNGDPRKPGTLHYLSKDGTLNDYEKAITSILHVLAPYDSNQQFPVWGFGAKYGGVVRHCFQCGPEAEVHGTEGIINAYHQTFKSGLIMSGPTVFDEVLQKAAAKAQASQNEAAAQGKQAYTVLLILTDGAVSDPGATARVLQQIGTAPLSVVIVGVGSADFTTMQFLDDASPSHLDIAQFVPFNQYRDSSVSLSAQTLNEIPDQLVNYFQRNSIQPLPPVVRADEDIVVEEEEAEIDLSLDFGDDGEIVVAAGGTDQGGAW
eukprot:CAMPEP_0194209022 /NCGR_PEP_ID=MMETSP0156-20130528/7294_1 /TAXON_ID=33649 /ORGANISM="Thalassionema nitzschioides, Strain L26-B" /LENGTH=570 /DNA_ID=CAMNT_0038936107 /DNA_START=4374 /DNA_END=6083 /DNA_ORIENTATION=+